MPRTPRIKSSTGIYHVMLRGADRQGGRQGDGSFVLTGRALDDMIEKRSVIICLGRRAKSQAQGSTT